MPGRSRCWRSLTCTSASSVRLCWLRESLLRISLSYGHTPEMIERGNNRGRVAAECLENVGLDRRIVGACRSARALLGLTDGMIALAEDQAFHGVRFDGRTFDCGSKIGFLSANVAYALAREDLAAAFRVELKSILDRK